MTHVTCRLTARTGISSGTLRSVIEYGLPLPSTFQQQQTPAKRSKFIYSRSMFSFLRHLTTCHCPHLLRRRPCSNRSISPARRAHSSKPAAAECGGQMMGQTDRQTDARPLHTATFLVTKNSRTFQDPGRIFPGPCRKPAMFKFLTAVSNHIYRTPSIRCARPHGLELSARRPPRTAGL